MTVQTQWDDEPAHSILRTQFIGAWTWREAHDAVNAMITMMESADHSVNIIIDMTEGGHAPPLAISEVRQLLSKRHSRAGSTVIVGANFMLMSLWKTIAQTYSWLVGSSQYSFADTLEEARARIAQATRAHR